MIIKFICRTTSYQKLKEIKRRTYLAGASVDDESKISEAEWRTVISSYRGSLYKEIEQSGLSDIEIRIIEGKKN